MAAPTPATRRHDLDALRAGAMLLGIALHAGLSFAPVPWPVQDTHQNGLFLLVFAAVHGFRMPLFFLLSGFFTAMLWRRRGLRATLWHRTRRIGLPLLLATVTIAPLVDLAGAWSGQFARRGQTEPVADGTSLVAAARTGDLEAARRWLADGADPNERDDTWTPPLTWAALRGDAELVERLLAAGADPDAPNGENSTALHGAAFFGHPDVVAALLDAGADPSPVSDRGETPLDSARVNPEVVEMVAEWLRTPCQEPDALAEGRSRVLQLLTDAGAVSAGDATAGDRDWRAEYFARIHSPDLAVPNPFPTQSVPSVQLFNGSFFHHLWFLRDLCWLSAMFAAYAWVAERMGFRGLPRWAVLSSACWLWLLPISTWLQSLMHYQQPGFGPDTYASLIPAPHLLAYYALFYFYGAFYYDADDADGRVGRWWPALLTGAGALLFPATFVLQGADHPMAAAACETLYAWWMTFGLMGLCRRVLRSENGAIRYVSDSSYWLYLIHMPLAFVAQAIVAPWDAPSVVKFALVCFVMTALLLASYQLLVRYTWIGALLNGKRSLPAPQVPAETPA